MCKKNEYIIKKKGFLYNKKIHLTLYEDLIILSDFFIILVKGDAINTLLELL